MALQSNWQAQVLHSMGAPDTPQNRKFLSQWQAQEGGGDHNSANFNPLNTTRGRGASINSVGVKAFETPQAGVQATVATILNGRYPNIAKGLRSGNPYGADISSDLSTWVSGSPSSASGARYASRVLGTRVSPPVRGKVGRPVAQAGQPMRVQGADPRKVLAQGLLSFVNNYVQSGELNPGFITQAVDKAGSLKAPTFQVAKAKASTPVASGVVNHALAAAHGQVGKPYQFGSGPDTSSFDCSDLIQWSYKQVGINIPRTTFDQVKVGSAINPAQREQFKPGDLIFPSPHHVVMYVGGGRVIAAPHTGTVVQYQPLSQWKDLYAVRRIVN